MKNDWCQFKTLAGKRCSKTAATTHDGKRCCLTHYNSVAGPHLVPAIEPPKPKARSPLTHDERWARMDKLAAGVK